MPSKKGMTLWYLILAPVVILSALYMGLEIRERIRPDTARPSRLLTESVEPSPAVSESTVDVPGVDKEKDRLAVISVFRDTKVFDPISTPVPTPTRPPEPTPVPSPLPLAENYKIMNILGTSAILMSYTLEQKIVRVGMVVEDPLGAFQVMEIDPVQKRVRVKLISDGHEKWLTEFAQPASSNPPAGAPPGPRRR
ncbi:MAG TPA: hypothetical protein PLQ35_15085 [bacterium]|nr:hypothetical protein [bacterium]HQL63607.1 hypothetical protein [bacterium]